LWEADETVFSAAQHSGDEGVGSASRGERGCRGCLERGKRCLGGGIIDRRRVVWCGARKRAGIEVDGGVAPFGRGAAVDEVVVRLRNHRSRGTSGGRKPCLVK
jgi:hypothetical protein